MNRSALVLVLLGALVPGVARANTTTREQQSVIARWTGENICKMGTERFYSLPEEDVRSMFERQTSMRYNDIPINPSESERNRITAQLTGYITAVCPGELESYRNR
jgi:hypothetical protein